MRRGAVASTAVDRNVPLKTLLRWSESLSAIARTGLGFTESLYEQERFEEILKVAADIRFEADEEAHDDDAEDGLVQEWMATVGKGVPGYVTPKVAVGAAVGNDKGELLLIQRADSGIWLYPTGWCDVGYSAAEVVVKEVEEETGIEVEPIRLIAVLDGLRLGFTRVPLYSLLFFCRAMGGSLHPHPLECRDVGWFTRDTMPSPIVGSERWSDTVFAALAGRTPRCPLRQCSPTHVAGRFARRSDGRRSRSSPWPWPRPRTPNCTPSWPTWSRSSLDRRRPRRSNGWRASSRIPPPRCCSHVPAPGAPAAPANPGSGQVVGMLTLVVFTLPTGVRVPGSRMSSSTMPRVAAAWRAP